MWSALGNSPIRLQNDGHSEPQSLNRIIKGRPFGVGCHRCARPPTKGAPSMIGEKYIGLDVHQATISVAVMDSKGKVVMESILGWDNVRLAENSGSCRGAA